MALRAKLDLSPKTPDHQYFTQANMRKLRDSGYAAPFRSLEDGVADYIQNYLTRPDTFR